MFSRIVKKGIAETMFKLRDDDAFSAFTSYAPHQCLWVFTICWCTEIPMQMKHGALYQVLNIVVVVKGKDIAELQQPTFHGFPHSFV